MQIQFQNRVLQCLRQGVQEVKNGEVTQELRLNEGMPDIGRVLATWGQCILRSKQWQGDVIEITGGVKTWTLYMPEDGTEPRVVESWLPFQQRWDVQSHDRTGAIRVVPLLRYADSRSISARKMMLRVGFGILCQAFLPMEAEVFEPGELPDDVALLRRKYPMRLPVEAGEKTFSLDEEEGLNLPGTGWKILSSVMNPEATDKRVMGDKLVFKGNGNLRILCRNQDGEIQESLLELPFSQFADLDGTHSAQSQADIQMSLTDLELDVQESGQLRVKCGLVAQYLIDEEQMLEVVEDAYSPHRQVLPEIRQLELPAVLEDKVDRITAEQSFSGQSGQVISAVCWPDHPRAHLGTDGIHMELSAQMQVLFYGSEGQLQSGCARWESDREIPADENCMVTAVLQPTGPIQVHTASEQITMHSQLQMHMQTRNSSAISMITALELGEPAEPDGNRPSLIVRRSAGCSLWELAKECASTVEDIRRANHLEGEPEEDQLLLIPVS